MERRPRAPGLGRVVETRHGLLVGPLLGQRFRRRAVLERERHDVTRLHDAVRMRGEVVILDGPHRCAREREHARATPRPQTAPGRLEDRVDESVLGAWRILGVELDLAFATLDHAQQHARRTRAELVAALVATHGQRVDDRRDAGLGAERRFEHEGLGPIPPSRLVLADRPDREVARGVVEDPAEHRRAVETWEAQPVDRAVAADERGGTAVGEQRVVGDRRIHAATVLTRGRWSPPAAIVTRRGR